ncbi:hypothetical protein BC936DRAFT_140217 [Jimgerdemannia flammicorona]|uniref:F-box domain-containing protein n=1 Tax=Jimgerdemannia flammicorona TaxID=994334 RepID=A0A433AVR9_9FUNG|nr:hypothetical protein BC936DRAFT_140217 [Jimgerdemannia flammicorona]
MPRDIRQPSRRSGRLTGREPEFGGLAHHKRARHTITKPLPFEIWTQILQYIKIPHHPGDTDDVIGQYRSRSPFVAVSQSSQLLRACALPFIWKTLHLNLRGIDGPVTRLANRLNKHCSLGPELATRVCLVMRYDETVDPDAIATISDRIAWDRLRKLTLVYRGRKVVSAPCAVGRQMLENSCNITELHIDGTPDAVDLTLPLSLETVRLSLISPTCPQVPRLVLATLGLPRLQHLVLCLLRFIEIDAFTNALQTAGPQLRTLYIDRCQNLFGDHLVSALSMFCVNLTRLEIRQDETSRSSQDLVLPHLEYLRLQHTVPRLVLYQSLCSIQMEHEGGPFDDRFFKTVSDCCPNLQTLILDPLKKPQNVTSEIMCTFLKNCPMLRILTLLYINVCDQFLATCAEISTHLRLLHLCNFGFPLTGKDVKNVSAWKHLAKLIVSVSSGSFCPEFNSLIMALFGDKKVRFTDYPDTCINAGSSYEVYKLEPTYFHSTHWDFVKLIFR